MKNELKHSKEVKLFMPIRLITFVQNYLNLLVFFNVFVFN